MEPMNVERWALIDRIFDEALDRPAGERASWVERACAGDAALLAAVRGLLASAAEAARVLGESAAPLADRMLGSADDSVHDGVHAARVSDAADAAAHGNASAVQPGGRIGPYRVIREIGRGGMGAVYSAERADGEFEKRVALKLVKRGMDTDEILRRFQHERRILASLEHPHIARLYDGGVSGDGRPYLVMELVDGLPVTEWCDAQRLDVTARLELFRTVCEAVQHAHQNLVVHRDIKPSNVLVAADGTPRLLDFGIAKLLDDDDASAGPLTRTGIRLVTPGYAAPEQLRGEAITTATDVYGLGALLYELLTGRRHGGWRRMHDGAAAEPEPVAPSAAVTTPPAADASEIAAARGTTPQRLRRRLRGDLDTIVATALEPRLEARYASVSQLMDDVARHLGGLPIRARPAGRWYRARKFARRNRVPLASAAVVALSLVGGAAAATVQAHRAARERDVAQHERGRAEQVTAFLVDLFDTADPTAVAGGGDTLRVRAVLDRGAERVRRELDGRPAIQGELLATLGRIYTNLGVYDAAEELLHDALALSPAAGHDAHAARLALLGDVAKERGDYPTADSLYDRAIAVLGDARPAADSLYAGLLGERGLVLGYLGRYDEALALHERALRHAERAGPGADRLRSRIVNNLAIVRHDLGEYAVAESLFRQVFDAERVHLRPDHPGLATTLNNIAASVHYQGRYAEAEPLYIETIRLARTALGALHPSVGDYVQNLATLYDDQARYHEAEPFYREAVRIYVDAFGRSGARTAMALRNLAINRHAVGELEEAESLLREIEASLASELGEEHVYTVVSSVALARVLTAAGRMGEAFDRLTLGLTRLEAQLPPGHYLTETARRDLGAWYAAARDFDAAEPLLLASHAALVQSRGEDHVLAIEAQELLRQLHAERGTAERAATIR
jgi:eukaryotic-like serine/threonine-protein kinase